MLKQWKFILSNWINCFNNTKTEECITFTTITNIISHLHKNFNLDESKSSVLEAQNIEEFILEKYPEFKFENGTLEPANEDELYYVASLLLFFVCVNSKDKDLKQTMCKQLSPEDQETIMRFSKNLMDCTPVTFNDVQGAIMEACGQDLTRQNTPQPGPSVAATPPALRSLHGEVRRLQAALDAERFDRNYLQEELTRINLRMEKLAKDKEQYKQEIVNLKAKISLYCVDEKESWVSEAGDENVARLTRQLEEAEGRLVDTQGKLDDVQLDVDNYKAKIEELKRERDKWLSISSEESIRCAQLCDELDTERRRVVALQEVVAELRQHHRNNQLDSSQLEVDDPDTSVCSLHNASVCSEACANVIEVQLTEEKAKVATLQRHIEELQGSLDELFHQTESTKLSLEKNINEKNNDICDLKHQLNEEIKEKNDLKVHFNNEITKLNNEINDLEQRLKVNGEQARTAIEQKIQEIQVLQDEKLSILQSFTNKTTKLENVIKNLEVNIDTEKNLKVKMKEEFENQLMKLNEKVSNRNNELVELQNRVFEKGEEIEQLNIDLRKQKELNHKQSNKYDEELMELKNEKDALVNRLQQKSEESKTLQNRLLQNASTINELNREIDELKAINNEVIESSRFMEQKINEMNADIQQRDNNVDGIRKEIEKITVIFAKEKDNFTLNLEKKSATINALQVRLRDEIQFRVSLEKELQHLHQSKTQLLSDIAKFNNILTTMKADLSEKDRMIYALELYLKEERDINKTLKANTECLNKEFLALKDEISAKNKEIESVNTNLANECLNWEKELSKKEEELNTIIYKLQSEVEEKEALKMCLASINEEKEIINKDLMDRCNELENIQDDYASLRFEYEENVKVIEALGFKIENETKKCLQLEMDFDSQTSNLLAKLSQNEKSVKDITSKFKHTLEEKELLLETLKVEVKTLNKAVENNNGDLEKLFKEKDLLAKKLEEEGTFKNNIEREYQNQCAMFDNLSKELNSQISMKCEEISHLKSELEQLMNEKNEKSQELKVLHEKLDKERKTFKDKEKQRNREIKALKAKIEEMHTLNNEYEMKIKKEEVNKSETIHALQQENEQLHFTIEEENSNREIIVKEKDLMIDKLEEQVDVLTVSLESLRKDFENKTFVWESKKVELQHKLEAQDEEITSLNQQIEDVKRSLEQATLDVEEVREELKRKDKLVKEKAEVEIDLRKQIQDYITELTEYKIRFESFESSQADLKLKLEDSKALNDHLSNEKKELLVQNAFLADKLHEEKLVYEILMKEKKALEEDKITLLQKAIEEREILSQKIEMLLKDKETILAEKKSIEEQLIAKEISAKTLMEEKEHLLNETCSLTAHFESGDQTKQQLILEKESTINELLQEKRQILFDKENITERLTALERQLADYETKEKNDLEEKEKCNIEITKRIESLLDDKQTLQLHLSEKEAKEKVLLEEIDNLTLKLGAVETALQQEKQIKSKLEEQIQSLSKEISELYETREQEILKLNEAIDIKTQEIFTINEVMKEEMSKKQKIILENSQLLDENSSLQHELKNFKEIVGRHKQELIAEKEALFKILDIERVSQNELEVEKNTVSSKLQELNEKYAVDMSEKQAELNIITSELKQAKTDLMQHEEINIGSVINSILEKILQNIDERKLENREDLQQLLGAEYKDMKPSDRCALIIKLADALFTESNLKPDLEKMLERERIVINELKDSIKEKETNCLELQTEVDKLQNVLKDSKAELKKTIESHNATLEAKLKDIQQLQHENNSLNNQLNDVKVQLEVKVHSLKEKLVDNENVTDKLKKTYECQIENLNMMVTKLTGYLKEKTVELESHRKEKEKLQSTIDECNEAIKALKDDMKSQKANQEKLIDDFDNERAVMKNMVTVTESVMEDQKVNFNNIIADLENTIKSYQNEKEHLEELLKITEKKSQEIIQEKQCAVDVIFKDLTQIRKEKDELVKTYQSDKKSLEKVVNELKEKLNSKVSCIELLKEQNEALMIEKEQLIENVKTEHKQLEKEIENLEANVSNKEEEIKVLQRQNADLNALATKLKSDFDCLVGKDTELKIKTDGLETELLQGIDKMAKVLNDDTSKNDKFKHNLQEKLQAVSSVKVKVRILTDEVLDVVREKNEYISKLDEVRAASEANEIKAKEEIEQGKSEIERLKNVIAENKVVISNLEQLMKRELDQAINLRDENSSERLKFENRCAVLQEQLTETEKLLKKRDREIAHLKDRIRNEEDSSKIIEDLKEELAKKNTARTSIARDKDEVIQLLNQGLIDEKAAREKCEQDLRSKSSLVEELTRKLEEEKRELAMHKQKVEELVVAAEKKDAFTISTQEKSSGYRHYDKERRHQVSSPTSDLTHSSIESNKTISDLERIIHDKNRTITTLQSDISYLKSIMAESENKLLDVTKELDITKEHSEQLSLQLKKIVSQKNEEIADLKKQVSKMSVTENRATQIIKVSAKYQAIILKRIAEIKSNTILKELTNFGNTANVDSDLKRNLNSGSITLEDLENFLETTDKHLKRCSDKQIALQKERDRLTEVNRINESEIINLKKFLTELSVSIKTFNSIKELYNQKMSRVVSMQRTVRREILSLDGHITDSMMCKLERGYAAVIQDLCECSMNLERWVERSISRTVSPEKLKQAFISDTERGSLAPTSYQNASLEVQLEELENSFQKLLEEVVRSQKGEGPKDAQSVTVMEVRAEYEDKLNRMKAKMKQLYQEQIQVFKNKQKEEVAALELELQKTREKMAESSRAYEEHIKSLTTELWNVGEKFLMKKDEAEWLRKKKSGSLMSLQHLHSSGLTAPHGEACTSRPSDAHSYRTLPTQGARERGKKEGRGLHMSDEEGEVFDNRWLKDLQTPRRESHSGRLSELRWRNSLCPPHLKSSYPAETQFANTLDEEDIKCADKRASLGGLQRKEVGITAYKKPGPPTPSKQAGRLSATDSELRESLRAAEPELPARKTSTPSRIRALFRSTRELPDGTPRKRISNIFKRK